MNFFFNYIKSNQIKSNEKFFFFDKMKFSKIKFLLTKKNGLLWNGCLTRTWYIH